MLFLSGYIIEILRLEITDLECNGLINVLCSFEGVEVSLWLDNNCISGHKLFQLIIHPEGTSFFQPHGHCLN